ncbi:helix-turn-helix transcriptional regulator [Alkalihalobacillus sp. NPDC078783]|uniref:helix-turn-helix transcriptional regulator n=1 Tax=Streptomyces albidoflavus TaxID=1886 RepID=UPI0033EF4329
MFLGLFGSGLGRPRSKLGKWLDKRGVSQQWLAETSGVSRSTISTLCTDDDYEPSSKTIKKVIKALKILDADITASFFFND